MKNMQSLRLCKFFQTYLLLVALRFIQITNTYKINGVNNWFVFMWVY